MANRTRSNVSDRARGPSRALTYLLSASLVVLGAVNPVVASTGDSQFDAAVSQLGLSVSVIAEQLERGERHAGVARQDVLKVRWPQGVVHEAIGWTCAAIEPEDSCTPVPDASGQPTALVWDLVDNEGRVTEQVWIGLFVDAEYLVDERQLVGLQHAGLITGQPQPTVYLMIGITDETGSVTWGTWGLRDFRAADLAIPIFDWAWVLQHAGSADAEYNEVVVTTYATAIEYGLIAALIAVVIIGPLADLGSALDDTLGNVADKIGESSGAPIDTDGDGFSDLADNCPDVANGDQADSDGDGIGDLCDRN